MKASQTKKGIFIVWFLAGLFAGGFAGFLSGKYSAQNTKISKVINIQRLTNQADNLLSAFTKLQVLNDKYDATLSNKQQTDSANQKTLDSLNNLLALKQNNFAATLDSLQNNKGSYDQSSYILLLKITDAYKAALAQSVSLNSIRQQCSFQLKKD